MAMDYHNSVPPPFAATAIPTYQYPHFVGHTDMSQIPEKIEPWEHDKHVS